MAKILFVNLPAQGHFNPTLPLVAALSNAGHTVDYLITKDFEKKVRQCNANLIPYYNPINTKNPKDIKTIRKVFKYMNSKLKILAPKYDLIVAGGMNPYITSLQREVKTPIIFCSAVFLQNEATVKTLFTNDRGIPKAIAFIARTAMLRKFLSKTIASLLLGMKIDDLLTMFSPQSSTLNVIFTSRYFQPEEKTFNEKCLFIGPTPTISLKDDTFPIERLNNSSKKIIYATLGTIFNTWVDFFKNIIEAFKASDYLVVMSTGNKERLSELGNIPNNFIVKAFVPQAEVLKYTDLFIAHGGMGSVSDGISMGVPMITVPLGADQFFNSYRLEELGACKVLKKTEVTPENLKQKAKLVMEDKLIKKNVKKLQASFLNSGGPELAVKEIEKLLKI